MCGNDVRNHIEANHIDGLSFLASFVTKLARESLQHHSILIKEFD